MKIDLHNYEAYLLDYLDGKLSATEVADVLLFLEQHQHIATEFEGLTLATLNAPEYSLNLNTLKKPTYDSIKQSYENILIAQLEGDATESELKDLDKAMTLYPELKNDAVLFKLSKFTPDTEIVFEHKHLLKKQLWYVQFGKQALRFAAALLLFGGVWFIANRSVNQTHLPISQLENSTDVNTKKPLPDSNNPKISAAELTKPLKKIRISNAQSVIIEQHVKTQDLQPISNTQLLTVAPQLNVPLLNQSQTLIAYAYPTPSNNDEYTSLATFIKRKLIKGTKQAGIEINANEETGKITRVEIAGLGIEWSQSK